ncbi:MAG: hypothetical protein QM214_00045 [Bacillota bacterium]|jgi:hypothetical protein|nr:hypothetical protein [Bacillota bacterium]HHU43712.1 hypothetical protein [Clostridiales bacterium]
MSELITSYFNQVYDQTYSEVMAYLMTRCRDINYVEDIFYYGRKEDYILR